MPLGCTLLLLGELCRLPVFLLVLLLLLRVLQLLCLLALLLVQLCQELFWQVHPYAGGHGLQQLQLSCWI